MPRYVIQHEHGQRGSGEWHDAMIVETDRVHAEKIWRDHEENRLGLHPPHVADPDVRYRLVERRDEVVCEPMVALPLPLPDTRCDNCKPPTHYMIIDGRIGVRDKFGRRYLHDRKGRYIGLDRRG